jgi:glycosyltransferase involved in cell wall biosynthesis
MRLTILAGGIPTTSFIDALINGMASENYKVTVIGKKTSAYRYHKNVIPIEIPKNKLGQALKIFIWFFRININKTIQIYRNAKSIKLFFYDLLFYYPIILSKPDKLHIQWATFIHEKELLFNFFPNKIILSLRGAHINYTPITHPIIAETYKKYFPLVHKFHAVSKSIAKEAMQYNAPEEKIHVIYSSVNIESIIKQKELKTSSNYTFIVVGRNHWVKGYTYLFDGLSELKKRGYNFTVNMFVGKLSDDLIYQIYQNGITENIILKNNVSHQEIMQEISNADALILSSINEGVANVVLEAMALKTPVIVSDCGGMSEIIKHEENGWLFETRNCQSLANELERFINNPDKLIIAETAYSYILNSFSRANMIKEFKTLYKN